jgi:type IV pilus assembly protein PilX
MGTLPLKTARTKQLPIQQSQHGAALIIALLILIVLLMLGIAAIHIGLQSERMSRNRHDRQTALQAAEAALREGEYEVSDPAATRYRFFAGAPPQTMMEAIYGVHTGHVMQAGVGGLPMALPRYVIEILPRRSDQKEDDRSKRFRITALGFGPGTDTRVMLQSVYRQHAPSGESASHGTGKSPESATAVKPGRLSWRTLVSEVFE